MEGASRRRLSGILAVCVAVASAVAVARAANPAAQWGTWALFGENATSKANLRVDALEGTGLKARVRFFEPDGKTAVTAFAISGERTMQMVLVRDDFTTFTHEHPDVDITTGTFHQLLTGLDAAHRYYLYADTIPLNMNEQVYRFNVQDQNIPAVPKGATLEASSKDFTVGPYLVDLSSTTITANQPYRLLIGVKEHGKMAWDLGPYQGGPGYATMINAQTLDYIHLKVVLRGSNGASARTDAMSGVPQSGPYMQTELPALPQGSYKLFFEFRGGAKIDVAPFTIVAE